MCSRNLFSLDKIRCQTHQNLEGSAPVQTQMVPRESLTYGNDYNRQGRHLELLPSPSITAGNLTEEQLYILEKESKSESWQFFPSDFLLYIYLTLKRQLEFPSPVSNTIHCNEDGSTAQQRLYSLQRQNFPGENQKL